MCFSYIIKAKSGVGMLDFIVLGFVPGTTYQITFGWVCGFAVVLLGLLLIKMVDEQPRGTFLPPVSAADTQ